MAFPQNSETLQKPPHHEVTVALKLIQVFVTDRKGDPVIDLRKEDFVVTDDDRPVDITEFESYVLLRPSPVDSHNINKAGPVPAAVPGQVRRLPNKFFLFFDFAYNNHRGIAKAKEVALSFLDTKIDPDAEVGVLSISMMRGMVIHEYLSTDHQKVRDTVMALDVGEALSAGRADDIEDEYWRRMNEAVTPGRTSQPGRKSYGELNAERQAARNQALAVLQRITELAQALRNVPGQKHFIFFSTGVPGSMIHGYSGYAQVTSQIRANDGNVRGYDFGDPILRSASEDMYKKLASSGCSVFSFDTREAALPTAAASLFAYEEETFGTGGRDIFSERGVSKPPVGFYKDDKLTGGYSIGRLSKRTGGEYFSNINEFEKNLNKVKTLTGNYYVLGYYVAEEGDGRFHDLKVKVLRKGCEARAQSGYFGPKTFRDYSDMEKGLHLIELALAGRSPFETPLEIPILSLAYPMGDRMCLDILARIPPDVIEKFRGRRVEVVTLVFDGQKNLAALRRVEADIPENEGPDIIAIAGCGLEPGRYDCHVVVRDLESGAAAVAAGKAEFMDPPSAGLRLFSPLLLHPSTPSIYLESDPEAVGKTEGRQGGLYYYDRTRFSPIITDEVPAGAGLTILAAIVPCFTRGILAPRLVLEAELIDALSGKSIPLALTSMSKTRKDNIEVFSLEFSLAGIIPGRYNLVVSAEDEGSGLTSESKAPLRIRN